MKNIDFREIAALQDTYKKIRKLEELYAMADILVEKYGIDRTDAYSILSNNYSLTKIIEAIDAADKPEIEYIAYVVRTTWADEKNFSFDANVSSQAFTSMNAAISAMNEIVETEKREGLIERWSEDDTFREEITEESYSCWLDGDYCFNHFEVAIESVKVC